jgi:hypothetical protein
VAVKIFEPQSREVAARLKELYAQIEQLDHTHILPAYDQAAGVIATAGSCATCRRDCPRRAWASSARR